MFQVLGCRFQLGLRFWNLNFRFQVLGCGFQVWELWKENLSRCVVWIPWYGGSGLALGIWGLGCRV